MKKTEQIEGFDFSQGGNYPNAWAELRWARDGAPSLFQARSAMKIASQKVLAVDARIRTIRLADGDRFPSEQKHPVTGNSMDSHDPDERFRQIMCELDRI